MLMNDFIVVNPNILAGKPVVRGTRIPVTLIVNLFANGYTIDKIIDAYPLLTKEMLAAALEYTEKRLDRETVHPLVEPGPAHV